MRITRDMMFMMMAEAAARRSTCRRLNVGAILVDDLNNVISIGYNGPPSGEPHCTGDDCGQPSCSRSIHAEKNAIDRAPPGLFIDRTLYVTNSPCEHCFKLIIKPRSCIKRVVFRDEYRINQHLKDLNNGIQIEKITPSGYLTDFVTGRLVSHP